MLAWEALARKHVGTDTRQAFEDLNGPIRQRDPMLFAGFHALAGDGPRPVGQVELLPARANRLAKPGCCENAELQRASRDRVAGSQVSHEQTDLSVAECGMVFNRRNRARRRQNMFESI